MNLQFPALKNFVSQKQLLLFVRPDRMKPAAPDQIINILSGTSEYLTCLGGIDNAFLDKCQKIPGTQRYRHSVFVEYIVWNGSLFIPENAVAVRLYFHFVEQVISVKIRPAGWICLSKLSGICNPDFTVSEE